MEDQEQLKSIYVISTRSVVELVDLPLDTETYPFRFLK